MMLIHWKIGSERELHNTRFTLFLSGILFLDILFSALFHFHSGGFYNECTSMGIGAEILWCV